MGEHRVALIGALLAAIGPVSMSAFTPAMPEIARDFMAPEATVKLTMSLYLAGFALALLVCGPLSDAFGRKPVVTGFMGVYVLASALALFAPSVEVLIAGRFFQGVGAAVGIAVSRAIVRDLFTGERAARTLNLIGLILGIGPALAPTLGGLTMKLFGWHAIFILLLALGTSVILIVHFMLVETVSRDRSRIRLGPMLQSYGQLLGSSYFLSASLTLCGAVGAFYTLAILLPFILMGRVGLTPTEFGLGMIMQSGAFFTGSLIVRQAMRRYGATRMVPAGATFILTAALVLAVILRISEPSFLGIMGPIALYAFGAAFVLPAMNVATLAPFPKQAGAAAALGGFIQLGGGMAAGMLAMLFAGPVTALATIIPGLGLMTLVCLLWWRTLPNPAAAEVALASGQLGGRR